MGTPTLWVCHFPNCITLPSGKCMFSLTQHHHLLQPATTLSLPLSRGHFHVRASQTNNARRIRRLKTDAEICSDIRQFVASVGLPEDHIPFTKELLDHGRKDLANIVRRRGHKQIRDLLKNSFYDDTDSLNTEKVPSMENHSNTSFNDSDLDTGDKEFSHLEPSIGLSVEQKDRGASEGLDDSNNNITEDIPTTSEFSENKIDSIIHSADSSGSLDTSFNLSLEEKVANFIQNGDLDPVEGAHPPKDINVKALNGNSLTSNQVVPSGKLDQPLRDDHMPHEDLITHFDKDLDAEAPKGQNQSEINHLKFMLYQKELELSRMKEQIEKEKRALSVLQTKAEEEISKARKLISEKDAELHVAEESLSGLKEVKIEFCGDGDVVEVAGSFNGWHHRLKMDPEPSTSVIDHGGSRESRLWSTMLWLYPGLYEIKFVVDGHWRTDPQRESVSRGHICNNILRVDR